MRAKQFIYTSWKNGNSPSKGFMVYSMSTGISQEDSSAIQITLKYLPPVGLPFAPTPEQIETMFPCGCAYFQLPSGKYCLGQSVYIGRDYSGRQGNYIIHAFVFDTKPDLNAFEFINSKIFKRSLTDEEANADSNPPPLPEIEVSQQYSVIDDYSLINFFNPEKLQILKYLIAAILQARKLNKCVYLYDDYSALTYWFRAIQMCLPEDIIKEITFSTYGISKTPSILLQSLKPGSVINYRMMLQLGDFVFNIKEKIINNKVAVGKFVNDVVDEFSTSVDAAKAKARAIAPYLTKAGNDPDFAITLSNFFTKDMSLFNTSEELMDVVSKLETSDSAEKDSIIDVLRSFEVSKNYNVLENDKFYRYLYENDYSSRSEVIAKYLNEVKICGERDYNFFGERYNELLGKITFPISDLLSHIESTNHSILNYLSTQNANAFLNYFLVRLLAENNDSNHSDVFEYYFNMQLVLRNIKIIHEINGLVKQKLNTAILDSLVLNELGMPSGILSMNNYDFLFAVIDELEISFCEKSLIILIKRCGKDNVFSNKAVEYISKRNIDVNKLLAISGNDTNVQDFIDYLFVIKFSGSMHTEQDIKKYYHNIYRKKKDVNSSFVKAFEKYFNSMRSSYETQVESAIDWITFFKSNPLYGSDDTYIEKMLDSVFYGTHSGDLLTIYNGKNRQLINKIDQFMSSIWETKRQYPPAYEVIDLGRKLQEATKGRTMTSIFEELCRSAESNTLLLDETSNMVIAKTYVSELFDFYCKVIGKEPKIADNVIRNVLAPLVKLSTRTQSGYKFAEDFAIKLSKLSFKEIMDFVIPFVNLANDRDVGYIIDALFAVLGGKTKKLIKILKDNKNLNGNGLSYLNSSLENKTWKNYKISK